MVWALCKSLIPTAWKVSEISSAKESAKMLCVLRYTILLKILDCEDHERTQFAVVLLSGAVLGRQKNGSLAQSLYHRSTMISTWSIRCILGLYVGEDAGAA